MVRVALLLGLCGCNVAFGLKHQDPLVDAAIDVAIDGGPITDLDGDHIPDEIDLCIAPASDALSDIDGDMIKNGVDKCPLNPPNPLDVDTDNDGLLDICDPNPALMDTRLCTMAFTDSTVTDALWRPVPANADFAHRTGALHCNANASCTTAAAEPIRAPTGLTIYVARFVTTASIVSGGIALWPRLSDVSTTTDIACVLYSDGFGYHLTILHAEPVLVQSITPPGLDPVFIRTSISSGMPATVTCNASTNKNGTYDQPDLSATIPPGPGTFGISATGWPTDVTGIEIIQH